MTESANRIGRQAEGQDEMDLMYQQVQRETYVPIFWHRKAREAALRQAVGLFVGFLFSAGVFLMMFYAVRMVIR